MPTKQKSVAKRKAEGTQEFFSKARRDKSSNFTFSAAPLNKDVARKEFREDTGLTARKKSNFVSKLYRDEDELEELKMMAGGDAGIDSDVVPDGDEEAEP